MLGDLSFFVGTEYCWEICLFFLGDLIVAYLVDSERRRNQDNKNRFLLLNWHGLRLRAPLTSRGHISRQANRVSQKNKAVSHWPREI